jgi:LuxR family transcriptional regulator, maltose regulon positive regulatory protein
VSRSALFGRLAEAERVVQISAPAGSGKTVLMQSWTAEAGLARDAAWVSVDSEVCDPRRFWISVADALRGTAAGSALVRPLTAAPDLDGWAVVERLLKDLAQLEDRLWLMIDDAHLLDSCEVLLSQLELLLLRAPQDLRFVLATRHDLRLGLHRLRLEGELTEIRAADLRFSLAEARALFGATGTELPERALAQLHGRTEGWAAGLRLAALSLAGRPNPERFAAEFSGTDRTVAEFLLAEVLDRQSAEGRRLLLRTSVLERVNGDLADLLTGASGGERTLQDLEQAGAFVVSLDAGRSWFRYHQLFADLLQLELRRTEPHERAALQRAAAGWLAAYGHPVEAVRQAQAAEDWGMAARLLSDHWLDLYLGGRVATLTELLGGFPGRVVAASPELTTVQVARDLVRGSVADAGRHLAQATGTLSSVPADRRGRVHVMLTVLRLFLARRLVDIPVVAEEAQRLLALTEGADAVQLGLGEDLRAAALISLGIAEMWAMRFEDAERHLQQGVALARQIGRPYLELTGLVHGAHAMLLFRPDAAHAERSWQAIELAERHGWAGEPLAGMAYAQIGIVLLYQGRLDDAEPWLERAEQTLRAEVEPAAGMSLRYARAVLELARGRPREALVAFRNAEKLAATLVTQHTSVRSMRSWMLRTLVRLGQTGRAEQVLAEHRRYRTAHSSAHSALTSQILDLLSGTARSAPPPGSQARWARSHGLDEQLTDSETRVLRYLPTHLTTPEIASELFLSVNTVSTHARHLYAKLGVHSRHEAVDRARGLGLLAPSARRT